jgi:nucleoside-diphosphate kinase
LERTLVILKPDAIQRGLAGEIISRLERRGLRIAGLRLMQMSTALARQHYAEHAGKDFYQGLIDYITSGPVIAACFEGKRAVAVVRETMGKTDPARAAPGTIRGDLGLEMGRNLIHGSDSLKSARRELALFFGDRGSLRSYQRDIDSWIFE